MSRDYLFFFTVQSKSTTSQFTGYLSPKNVYICAKQLLVLLFIITNISQMSEGTYIALICNHCGGADIFHDSRNIP